MARKTNHAIGETLMKDPQLEKLSLKELKDLKVRVEKAVQSKQDSERVELRDKFKMMAEEAGFQLSDVVGGGKAARGKTSAAVKFQHPDNPSLTWSGRGRMPKWLSEQVKSGVDPKTFKI